MKDGPRVGVATLVFRDGRLLLGRRLKTPGYGSWQCPGGLLQSGETVFDCARRETLEETGMDIDALRAGPYTDNHFAEEQLRTITLYVVADYVGGEAVAVEAQGVEWQWFDLDQLPQPLFLPLQLLLDQHRKWLKKQVMSC